MSQGKPQGDTGSVFFNGQEGQYGRFYKASKPESMKDITISIAKSGDLQVKAGKDSAFFKPKTNDRGTYYIAEIAGGRYFVSERENSKGPYLLAKPAPDRPQGGAQTVSGKPVADRPQTYGARK